MAAQHSSRNELDAAEQASIVRLVPDRMQADFAPAGLQQHIGATNGELTDTALAKAAADDNPLGRVPGFQVQQTTADCGELLCELLDRAQHDACRYDIAPADQLVQLRPLDL